MFGADKGIAQDLDGKRLYIAIVQARFNEGITTAMLQACKAELLALGVQEKHIDVFTVPGALEISVALKSLAQKDQYDALIALGCIIRGETYHFEVVANESARGVTQVSLEHSLPIANEILTCENVAQAHARQDEKGRDAARVAVEMANLLNDLA
jgi:6,7-dimethyl-8-ribityllumazine synthase